MTDLQTHNGAAAARFIAGAAGRRYPPEVVDAAKQCILDWFGVALGAFHEPTSEVVRRTVRGWQGQGRAQLLLEGTTAPALAALANGTTAHVLDFDDTDPFANVHVTAATWAATYALASHLGRDGAAALSAFITGFEVAGKLGAHNGANFGRMLQFRGFHPTAVLVRFGAAAAAAALLGLDEARVAHALGVAATTAGGLNASFGTMSKPFHAGKAAMDGVLAAQLAAEDFEAATHLLDAPNGLHATLVQDGSAPPVQLEFTEGWELTRNAFKPYACCKGTHPAVDAARSLAGAVGEREIERIELQVHPQAKLVAGKPDPQTPLEAKFSLAYCVSIALRGARAVSTDFDAARLRDPALRDLIRRVAVEPRDDLEHTAARMAVRLRDGTTLDATTELALGNPGNPMSWDDLCEKFRGMAAPVLGDRTEELLGALRAFDAPGSFAAVQALLAGPAA